MIRYSIGSALTLMLVLLAGCVCAVRAADDAPVEVTKQDQALYVGVWNVVSMDVNSYITLKLDNTGFTVVNDADGNWTLRGTNEEGRVKDLAKGTSKIDATKSPKAIDLVASKGENAGKVFPGIYEIDENTRTICFAPPDQPRPTEFAATDSGHVVVKFERIKQAAAK